MNEYQKYRLEILEKYKKEIKEIDKEEGNYVDEYMKLKIYLETNHQLLKYKERHINPLSFYDRCLAQMQARYAVPKHVIKKELNRHRIYSDFQIFIFFSIPLYIFFITCLYLEGLLLKDNIEIFGVLVGFYVISIMLSFILSIIIFGIFKLKLYSTKRPK